MEVRLRCDASLSHQGYLKKFAGRPFELDVKNWVFILLSAPDGGCQVLLSGRNLPLLTDAQRRQAAADVLCNILGEQLVLDVISCG
jgi:hypothetical protein